MWADLENIIAVETSSMQKKMKKIHDFTHVESKNVDLREEKNSAYQERWWEVVVSGAAMAREGDQGSWFLVQGHRK